MKICNKFLCTLTMLLLNSTSVIWGNDPSYYYLSKIKQPSAGQSSAIGGYANGCLAGGVRLPQDGDGFQLMRLSRERYYVHPDLFGFITEFAHKIKQYHPFGGILVGDTGGAIGGPMESGHASHQSGLDVDIWLRPPFEKALTLGDRENLSAMSHVTPQQTIRNSWTKNHTEFVLTAAQDERVARIFVNPAIKRQICLDVDEHENLMALSKIRPWYGHDSHMHVRIKCPATSKDCINQAEPLKQSGCSGNDIEWWFSDEALNPKPSTEPKVNKTLQDLPEKCIQLYNSFN